MSTAIAAFPFFGGTLSGFDPSDNTVIEATTAGTFNSTMSTCSLFISANGSSNATSPTWSAAATQWVHAVIYVTNGGNTVPEQQLLYFLNGATVVAKLTVQAPSGPTLTYRFYTLQSGVLTQVGSSFTTPTPTLQTFDFQIVGNSASGSAAVFVAGTKTAANASSLNHSGFTGVTQIQLWGGTWSGVVGGNAYWSQVICDSTSTVGRFVRTDRLNTNSATNTGWTGGVTNINEIPTNDSQFISSASAAQISTFYESGQSLTGYTVGARGVSARMRLQGSGPPNIQLAVRSGGTNYASSAIAGASNFQAAFNSWTTDPNTSAAWTTSGAASAESGVQSHT